MYSNFNLAAIAVIFAAFSITSDLNIMVELQYHRKNKRIVKVGLIRFHIHISLYFLVALCLKRCWEKSSVQAGFLLDLEKW